MAEEMETSRPRKSPRIERTPAVREAMKIRPATMADSFRANVHRYLQESKETISVRDLMRKLGRSESTPLSRITDHDPYLSMIYRMANALSVDPDRLLELNEARDSGEDLDLSEKSFRSSENMFRSAAIQGRYPEAMQSALELMTLEDKLYIAHGLMKDAGMNAESIISALKKLVNAEKGRE